MDRIARQRQPPPRQKVGIGQVDRQQAVIVLHGRAEQQGPAAVEQDLQVREIARILVEQPFRTALATEDVAVVIEHTEHVAMLERPRPPLEQ